MTRNIFSITILTILALGSQESLQGSREAAPTDFEHYKKAAEPQFKITSPEETMAKQQTAAQKAMDTAKTNVPTKGARNVSNGTADSVRTNGSTGVTTRSQTLYNADGTTTVAVYQSTGEFEMNTTHQDGKSTIQSKGNINTGDVFVRTVDATDRYGSGTKSATGKYNTIDGTFDMKIQQKDQSITHQLSGDPNNVEIKHYDADRNERSLKTITDPETGIKTTTEMINGKKISSYVMDGENKVTTTFDPKTTKETKIETTDKSGKLIKTSALDPKTGNRITTDFNNDGSETTTFIDKNTKKETTITRTKEQVASDEQLGKSKTDLLTEAKLQAKALNVKTPEEGQAVIADAVGAMADAMGIKDPTTITQVKTKMATETKGADVSNPSIFKQIMDAISRMLGISAPAPAVNQVNLFQAK